MDTSSGALGSAVNRAIDTLVPIIARADVDTPLRERWLDHLWETLQEDDMPYIEFLGDHWGDLCVTPEVASQGADEFLSVLASKWGKKSDAIRYAEESRGLNDQGWQIAQACLRLPLNSRRAARPIRAP